MRVRSRAVACLRKAAAPAAACLLLRAGCALAAGGGGFTPFVGETLGHDDNVFRISDALDPAAAIGSASRGDSYRTTSAGFDLDLPLSRQRLQAGLALNDTRYQRFTDLDFTARDAHATWLWQLGDRWRGHLGYMQSLALASFADIQAREPDRLDTRRTFFDARMGLSPRWRLGAGASRLTQSNSDPARSTSDVEIDGGEVSATYVTRAETSLGLRLRAEDGRFPRLEQLAGGGQADRAYRQSAAELTADWTPSGASHLSGRLGRLSRRYSGLAQRNFSGNTAYLEYDWKPGGRLSLAAVAQQDIGAYEDIRSNFVLVKGVALRPGYRVSAKIDLTGNLEYRIRDFLGDPGLVPGQTPGRSDRVRTAGLAVSYRPTRALTLQLSAQRERRSSNTPLADYQANGVLASLRLAF